MILRTARLAAILAMMACANKTAGDKPASAGVCQHNGNGQPDSAALDHVRQAIAKQAGKPGFGVTALVGVGEACAKELPDPIAKAMRAPGQGVAPAQLAGIAAAALAKVPEFGRAACNDFDKVMPAIAAAQADQAKLMYDGCQYQALDLMTADELATAFAGDDKGGALLAPATYAWLLAHDMAKADARLLARAMMGLPTP